MTLMSGVKFSLVSMLFLVLASQFFVVAVVAEAREDVVASALTDTEEVLASAYQAVLEAEEAGANVSSLLVQLNEAGGLLAQGHMAYRLGDFDEAVNFAELSSGVGIHVKDEALKLKDLALGESLQHLYFTAVGSVIFCVLIVFGSFLVWRVFKRRHYQRVLRMKPEVSAGEI